MSSKILWKSTISKISQFQNNLLINLVKVITAMSPLPLLDLFVWVVRALQTFSWIKLMWMEMEGKFLSLIQQKAQCMFNPKHLIPSNSNLKARRIDQSPHDWFWVVILQKETAFMSCKRCVSLRCTNNL